MLFHTSLYLQAVLGKTPSQTGLFITPAIAGSVIGGLSGGFIMQKSGKYYRLTVAAYMTMAIGVALVALYTGVLKSSLPGITIGTILFVTINIYPDEWFNQGLPLATFGYGTTPNFPYLWIFLSLSIIFSGIGMTTTLISTISNAGLKDQAIATAGM
jgi:hypothetical protein